MRLVLTDVGCTYEGEETTSPGALTVDVENQTSLHGSFTLVELAARATIDDLEAHIEAEEQRLQEGKELLGPPAFYSQVVEVSVDAGANSDLPADVPAGTYVLTCFVDDMPTWRAYVAGQLEVTG